MKNAAQNPVLVELTAELKEKFLEMAKDYHAAGEDRYDLGLNDFDAYLKHLEMYRTGSDLPAGHVRSNSFFLLADDKLVGSGNLRHELNAGLSVFGGHIGYNVRPSERRKGYGSLILRLALEKARALGLKRVFLTCDTDNVASAKIIEKHGGKLDNQIIYVSTGKLISQYWIELNKKNKKAITKLKMKIFHGTDNAGISRGTVLTLGVFDGLHLGHQRIMQTVVERARSAGAVPTVITFDPHPRAVLHPENAPPLLQTLDQRLANFEVLGIEQTIVIRFDHEFAGTDAETFLADIVHERLQAKEVFLGKGFFFGKNRGGNIELLRQMSLNLGFFADEVAEVRLRGQRISSSKIRQLLADGKVNLARRMLGRPYGVEGQIIHGFERGRTIGFPTANLKPHNRVVPKFGVYATATLIGGEWRRSITNVGVRPTFDGDKEPSIESYVFDFDGDLYGDVLRVRFLHRLRDERKFGGIDELRAQIEKDVKRALLYFKRQGVNNSLNIV